VNSMDGEVLFLLIVVAVGIVVFVAGVVAVVGGVVVVVVRGGQYICE